MCMVAACLQGAISARIHTCWCPEWTIAPTGDDSYILTVQPGADLAFFVAVTISLNDILNPDMA